MTDPHDPGPRQGAGSPDPALAFAQAARQRPPGLVRDFLAFLAHNKKWWLVPILAVLLLVGALVVLGGTALSPFVYALF